MTIATVGHTPQGHTIARHWIDGHWHDSVQHKDSINPATGEVIGRYALAGEDEAREAVAAAARTFRGTPWKHDRALRSRVLHQMAERFEAHIPDLIHLVSIETGKVVPDATFEVSLAASGLRYYAALVLTEYARAAEWAPGHFSLLVREPIGVAGISVPWNAPVALLIRSLAPALAAGCTTVVKMPGKTAQLTARISEVISEAASLPRGVVNIVTGDGSTIAFISATAQRSPLPAQQAASALQASYRAPRQCARIACALSSRCNHHRWFRCAASPYFFPALYTFHRTIIVKQFRFYGRVPV